MNSCLKIAFLALISAFGYIRADEVCCKGNICYTDEPPFDGLRLPQCVEDYDIQITMYTRDDRRDGKEVTRDHVPRTFDNKRLTIFYTHGWLGSSNNNWLEDMKDMSLEKGDYNVIIVGWQKSAHQLWYPQSAADTRSVGMEIGLIAEYMVNKEGLDRSLTYCVGHSLGGHACGHAGNYFKFGRITGMDPAGPLFENRDLACGLNPDSADLVDVIHTNGEPNVVLNLGTMRVLGHIDFYPNGGGRQPECILDPLNVPGLDSSLMVPAGGETGAKPGLSRLLRESGKKMDLLPACSHMRAIQYFRESILTPCFTSNQRCTDQYSLPKSCATAPDAVQSMGFNANLYSERGIFYLLTSGDDPYCLGSN